MIIVREHLAGDHLLCSRMLLGWPVTPPPPAREQSRWLVDCNPRILSSTLAACFAAHAMVRSSPMRLPTIEPSTRS